MVAWLVILTIGLPWLGALLIWLQPERETRSQHILAVVFSVASGFAALALLPNTSAEPVLNIPLGTVFGDFTFVADGLGTLVAVMGMALAVQVRRRLGTFDIKALASLRG